MFEATLIVKGILKDRIRKYDFDFEGKNVLVGENKKLGKALSKEDFHRIR